MATSSCSTRCAISSPPHPPSENAGQTNVPPSFSVVHSNRTPSSVATLPRYILVLSPPRLSRCIEADGILPPLPSRSANRPPLASTAQEPKLKKPWASRIALKPSSKIPRSLYVVHLPLPLLLYPFPSLARDKVNLSERRCCSADPLTLHRPHTQHRLANWLDPI